MLRQKDQRALMMLVIALILFSFVQFVLFPLLTDRKQLKRKIRNKESALAEMRIMQDQIKQLSLKSNSLEQVVAARPADFSLYAFLEEKCAETQVKDNISYMEPSDPSGDGALQQIKVEMKLKAVRLNLLIAFLERVESAEHIVALKRISIQLNKKEQGTLDVIMQVITLVRTEITGD